MEFDLEYKLQLFREEQPELFDAKGKRYTGTEISNRTTEMMFELINELESALAKAETKGKQHYTINSVSNSALIDYIENDAEIAMPINEMFNDDGTNITKKKYGKVLLKYLVKELREHYC